jgi:aspartyl-tRNA(Asn)/glutamyl-tRNA(Gln) amidotransferase subunit C
MKPKIDRATVLHVAALARLQIAEEELPPLIEQMGRILDYVALLDELDLSGVEPTSHAVDLAGSLRDDAPRPGLPREAALALAPDPSPPYFRTPKAVEGGGDA